MYRTLFFAVSVFMTLIFFGSLVSAQHMGRGMRGQGHGMGPERSYGGWYGMSAEEQEEWKEMRTKFLKDTLDLRKELVTAQMELHTLWVEDHVDSEAANNLADKIAKLQGELLGERNEFLIKCRDEFGDRGWSCPGGGYGMGQGMMGYGYGMGPGMRHMGYGMGSGMMGGGYGMGPGAMHGGWQMGRGYGPGYGPGNQGRQYSRAQKVIEKEDAKELLEDYLKSTRNPNLKLGKITDRDTAFEGEILTKDGSLVDKIHVNKKTGWMRSVY